MALPIASALLIITHMLLLLSTHRFMWLSQMLQGLTALAVCSEAEPSKQLLCLLDFVLKKVKRGLQGPLHLSRGEVRNWVWTEFGPRLVCHCWSESKWETGLNLAGGFSDEVHSAHAQSQVRGYSSLSLLLPALQRWKGLNSPRNQVSSDHRVSAGFLPQCKGPHRGGCCNRVDARAVF